MFDNQGLDRVMVGSSFRGALSFLSHELSWEALYLLANVGVRSVIDVDEQSPTEVSVSFYSVVCT